MGWECIFLSFVVIIPFASSADSDIDDCSLTLLPLKHGHMVQAQHSNRVILYSCNPGFILEGPIKQACVNGTWNPPEQPVCKPDGHSVTCPTGPLILNGSVKYGKALSPFNIPKGTMASVVCDPGFSSAATFELSFVIVCGPHGLWTMPDGSIGLDRCTRKRCPNPPEVPRAHYRYNSYNHMGDGMQVEYVCSRDSVLLGGGSAILICRNGQWEGPIPTCVQKATCETPAYITNGKWSLITKDKREAVDNFQNGYTKFEVGAEVEYSCSPGYKLEGPMILQCTAAQIWSRSPPMCIPNNEHIWYCPSIDQIKNGYCKCMGQETADLQLCMPFIRGTSIECTCLNGYALDGVSRLTCTHSSSLNIGVWDWEMPTCYKVYEQDNLDRLPDGQIGTNGKSYSSGDISDDKNKVSSLVIVITTACSVLGVLGLIMIIVIFRKKKPRAHIFQQGAAAPPYARVHNNSMDEHDRLALMAYAEASRVHLPSYEEAMRPDHINTSGPGGGGTRSISPTSLEYQRLPNIHFRGSIHPQHPAMGGDGNNNINNNNNNNSANNRHSTVTTSTMNRDGVSEISGSVDTVNVSMSDASTSVTVETFDSGTSNRSMASQRATAGSLNSSEDHLATDDAPLLETNSQREPDVVSVSSNPSRTSKED